ncbi:MAG: alpha/beta fold hydrolase [Rhodobacterales bacterium]|nr:alpha/beta fold hydrolase [Rhodobacterales bacterium]MDX5411493.1 alpha/beta fold hydrolase [Rhodobacterales bacterium]
MDWAKDLKSWPNAQWSRLVAQRPHRWHVQESGKGPTVLLIHGAGGATHSWRDILPDLARDFRVIALDLPGQGLTQIGARQRCGLDAMTEDIASLCTSQNWTPDVIIGHSAGAAIALRLSQRLHSSQGQSPVVIGLNAALGPFKGVAGWLFPVLAKMLALNPLTAGIFVRSVSAPGRIQSLIRSTGSELDAVGMGLYERLIRDKQHVEATLLMMSQWRLDRLLADLPHITTRTILIAGLADKAVPPTVSERAVSQMPDARFIPLPGLGHLAHEERPDMICTMIRDVLRQEGILRQDRD